MFHDVHHGEFNFDLRTWPLTLSLSLEPVPLNPDALRQGEGTTPG